METKMTEVGVSMASQPQGWPPDMVMNNAEEVQGGSTQQTSFKDKLLGRNVKKGLIPEDLIEKKLVRIEFFENNPVLPIVVVDASIMRS